MAFTLVTCASCGVENSLDKIVCLQCGADLGTLTLPLHLAPLLLPTPSGVTKLIAAWDGLSAESQILILAKLDTLPRPDYLNELKIRIKAFDNNNAYVRYLAVRNPRFTDALKQRIEQDPESLVRYSLLETKGTAFGFVDKGADAFFALPHEARLAIVRALIEGGEKIAKIMAHAIDHQLKEGSVSEIELYEILCDYTNKPSFREHYASVTGKYGYPLSELRDIRALWELVPKLPETISYVLIDYLPAKKIDRETVIPDEVPKHINSRQLQKLLDRSDVGLEEFRKEVFWRAAPDDFMTWSAAASHNFNLSYMEFAKILAKPKEEKAEILRYLSYAEDLSLYLYEAITDALLISDDNAIHYPWPREQRPKVKARLSALSRLRGLHEFAADEFAELRDLGLYRVASEAMRWKKGERRYPLKGELEFLSKHVVQGDIWQTFMAFHEAWDKGVVQLSEYLPEWTRPPQDPEELFGDAGREGTFLEDKIDFIARKLSSLPEIREETQQTWASEESEESVGEKVEKSNSLEDKIDSIKTKLLFYEEKLETFVKNLKYIMWTVIIVIAISYGWKLLARLF